MDKTHLRRKENRNSDFVGSNFFPWFLLCAPARNPVRSKLGQILGQDPSRLFASPFKWPMQLFQKQAASTFDCFPCVKLHKQKWLAVNHMETNVLIWTLRKRDLFRKWEQLKERQKTDVNMNLATDPGYALLLALWHVGTPATLNWKSKRRWMDGLFVP